MALFVCLVFNPTGIIKQEGKSPGFFSLFLDSYVTSKSLFYYGHLKDNSASCKACHDGDYF